MSLIRCGHCGGDTATRTSSLRRRYMQKENNRQRHFSLQLASLPVYSRRANRRPLWRVEKYHLLWEKNQTEKGRGGEGHTRPCSSFFRFPPCERGRETLFSLLPSASNITLRPKEGGGGTLSLSILMVAMMTGERRKEEEEREGAHDSPCVLGLFCPLHSGAGGKRAIE